MSESEKKAKAYWRYKNLSRLLSTVVLLSFLYLIQFAGASLRLETMALSLHGNFYVALELYLVSLSLLYGIVTFPLNLFEGFILEHRFSLSNLSFTAWLKDGLKQGVISIFIFSILIQLLYAVARTYPANWWLISSLSWTGVSVVFAKIFPVLIIPLFYRYSPVRSSELRDKILKTAAAFNIKVLDVFEINFSAKTKKSNAAVVGWGDTRRIILADNLVNEFTPEEVEVVVAHEMAHYKLRHIWKLISLSAVSTAISFYILNLAAYGIASSLSRESLFDIALFPALALVFTLYGIVASPVLNGISRKLENDADLLALKMTRLKDSFISLMERLAEKNLSDKNPNRLIEFLFYDHPPIAKRIELAKRFSA